METMVASAPHTPSRDRVGMLGGMAVAVSSPAPNRQEMLEKWAKQKQDFDTSFRTFLNGSEFLNATNNVFRRLEALEEEEEAKQQQQQQYKLNDTVNRRSSCGGRMEAPSEREQFHAVNKGIRMARRSSYHVEAGIMDSSEFNDDDTITSSEGEDDDDDDFTNDDFTNDTFDDDLTNEEFEFDQWFAGRTEELKIKELQDDLNQRKKKKKTKRKKKAKKKERRKSGDGDAEGQRKKERRKSGDGDAEGQKKKERRRSGDGDAEVLKKKKEKRKSMDHVDEPLTPGRRARSKSLDDPEVAMANANKIREKRRSMDLAYRDEPARNTVKKEKRRGLDASNHKTRDDTLQTPSRHTRKFDASSHSKALDDSLQTPSRHARKLDASSHSMALDDSQQTPTKRKNRKSKLDQLITNSPHRSSSPVTEITGLSMGSGQKSESRRQRQMRRASNDGAAEKKQTVASVSARSKEQGIKW